MEYLPLLHTHLHTSGSLLDGVGSIKRYVEKAKEYNHPAICCTDHGNAISLYQFYKECKEGGIKPILGCEFYITTDLEIKLQNKKREVLDRDKHLIVLIKNEQGYKNFCKLIHYSYAEGYYYKPRITYDMLWKYKEGLVIGTACAGGMISQLITHGMFNEAEEWFKKFKKEFGDDFYAEIQFNELYGKKEEQGIDQKEINDYIVKLAKKHNVKIILSGDVHYADAEDAKLQDIVINCMTRKDGEATEMGQSFIHARKLYYQSSEDFFNLNKEFEYYYDEEFIKECFENSLEIADKCNFDFITNVNNYPKFTLPKGVKIKNYITELAFDGLQTLLESRLERGVETSDEELIKYEERIKYEIDIIADKGYLDYFLVYHDMIKWARENDIQVGVGRGSAGGSLLSYSLGIVSLDPIEHGLYFERFINPSRSASPDIDLDIEQGGRELIRKYLEEKYGKESVYGVMTQTVYQAKSAIQDVSRGLGKDTTHQSTLMREITKLPELEKIKNLREYFDNIVKNNNNLSDTIVDWLEDNEDTIYWADKLMGLTKNVGTHAGGIVIAPGPIYDYIPVTRAGKEIVTAFRESDGSGHDLSDLGLLKCDILGLKTLNVIKGCVNDIKRDLDIDISNDINYLDLKNPKLYKKFNKGNNVGVFQLEGPAQDFLIKTIKPDCFDDVVAINAINRPGPLEAFGKVYGLWKRWEKENNVEELKKVEKERYPFDFMKKTLKKTYGCLIAGEKVYDINIGQYTSIENYSEKRKIQAYNQNSFKYVIDENVKILDNGIKHVNEYILTTGYSLTCTPDHKIATSNGEMQIEEAYCNNIPILIPKKLLVNNIIEYSLLDKKRARILGLLLGDGSLTTSVIYLTASIPEIIEDFVLLIEEVYDKCKINKRPVNLKRKTARDNFRLEISKNDEKYIERNIRLNYIPNQLVEDLRKWNLCFLNKKGVDSYTKFVPSFIFTADDETKKMFLSGLWDADGTVVYLENKPVSANYSTMNKKLAEGILLILRQLNYLPTITQYKSGVYKIFLPLSQFSEISVYCKHPLKRNISFSGDDIMNNVYLYKDIHYQIRKESTVRGFLKKIDVKQLGFYKKNKAYKCFNNKMKLVFDNLQDKTLKNQSENSYSVLIKKRKEIGKKQVYDLNVLTNPWFVAGNGGITVHNCLLYQEQLMLMVCEVAGFNMGEADTLRRAIGWPKSHPKYYTVEPLFEKLKKGIINNGYSESDVEVFLEYCRKFMGYSFNLCLTENHTIISKKRGEIKLLEVEIGEEILAYNINNNTNEYVVVENIYNSEEQEVYLIKTESGKQVECSLNHFILSEEGKKPLSEILSKNIKIKIKSNKTDKIKNKKKPIWENTPLLNNLNENQKIEFLKILNKIYTKIKSLDLYDEAVYAIAKYKYLKNNFNLEEFLWHVKLECKNIPKF